MKDLKWFLSSSLVSFPPTKHYASVEVKMKNIIYMNTN